jgi:hypothetical protein
MRPALIKYKNCPCLDDINYIIQFFLFIRGFLICDKQVISLSKLSAVAEFFFSVPTVNNTALKLRDVYGIK